MCHINKSVNERTSGKVKNIRLVLDIEFENGEKQTRSWDLENINIDENKEFDLDGEAPHIIISIDADVKIKESEYDEGQ